MTDATRAGFRVEAEQGDEARALAKAALTCVVVSAVIVGAGFVGLGRDGMLDPHSPDFFPLPHFCAFVGLLLAAFFLVRALIHGRRYRLFGTSVVEGNVPVLGERLAGTLRIAKAEALSAPIALRLCCDWRHYTEGLSSASRAREISETLWEDARELAPTGAAIGLPFQFELPADGLPSGRRPRPKTGVHPESPGQIIWVLRATSRRSGTDYCAEFEVPVKPGRVGTAGARPMRPPATRPDTAGGAVVGRRVARALGAVLATLLGGRVPSAGELRDEAEADARTEPARPFASRPWEDIRGPRAIGVIALAVGVFLCAIALYTLSRQAMFSWRGTLVPATITTVERGLVTLDLGVDDRSHRISISSFRRWDVGQQVAVVCVPADAGGRRCRMATGFDRWLDGLACLAVALVALTIWRRARTPRA